MREKNSSETDTNIGKGNTGKFNIGFRNSGLNNIGAKNSGSHNIGPYNSGSHNIGGSNTGDYNIGFRNSGSGNIGFRNSGSGNICDFSSGFFGTKTQLMFFDAPTDVDFEDIDLSLIEKLCVLLSKDESFDPTPFLSLPNATADKIKKLHELHIQYRQKMNIGK